MPVVAIAPRISPTPNAFDIFVEAGNAAAADDTDIGDMLSETPKKSWTVAQKQALLARNAPLLARVRRGLLLPYRDRSGPRSYETKLPHYAHFRTLARLFVLEGNAKREMGDLPGAAQSYQDGIAFGQKIKQGAPLIGGLVSAACEAIGRKPLWNHLSEWDGISAKTTARRLAQSTQKAAQNASFADTLVEEKAWGQSELLKTFRKENTQIPTNDLSFVIWTKRDIMDGYTNFMDTFAQNARTPYQLHKDAPPIPRDPLNALLLPVFAQARYKSVACDTQNALLIAALASRAYQADHRGAAPKNLQALVPAYLSAVPVDPFSYPIAPLKSRIVPSGAFQIYSIGPDGRDDNATPALNDRKETITPKNKYFSSPTSKGDIVAGVNAI